MKPYTLSGNLDSSIVKLPEKVLTFRVVGLVCGAFCRVAPNSI